MKNALLLVAFALMITSISPSLMAADDPINTGVFSDKAVRGYDTVAYFKSGKPIKGNKKFKYEYMGAEWLFSSAENMVLFKENPTKYAPQYGGYCSWAAGRGYLADGNPKNWRIVDGRLYLNYDSKVQEKWEKDIPGFIAKANVNYPALVDLEEQPAQ